jgi:hypothetical protein
MNVWGVCNIWGMHMEYVGYVEITEYLACRTVNIIIRIRNIRE